MGSGGIRRSGLEQLESCSGRPATYAHDLRHGIQHEIHMITNAFAAVTLRPTLNVTAASKLHYFVAYIRLCAMVDACFRG